MSKFKRVTRSSSKVKSSITLDSEKLLPKKTSNTIYLLDSDSDSESDHSYRTNSRAKKSIYSKRNQILRTVRKTVLLNSSDSGNSSDSNQTVIKSITENSSSTNQIREQKDEVKQVPRILKTPDKIPSLLKTPSKDKSRRSAIEENYVTPPKQRKSNDENSTNALFSPSSLFRKLDINSPPPVTKPEITDDNKKRSAYQNARKALHSAVPINLPGRETEMQQVTSFIKGHLENCTSGSLYVSGPPGTGKTATLSTIFEQDDICGKLQELYVNCTAIKSAGAVYSKIVKELCIKSNGRSEKENLLAIQQYLTKKHRTILLVLDEMDQLESKNQSILYTIFEWPVIPNANLILIGIANALDLTDRILPRLQARCELKPELMHFAPYSKKQIVDILTARLQMADVTEVFAPAALQMLAGKVAAISGDVRKALDISRRVIELVEQQKREVLTTVTANITTSPPPKPRPVNLTHIMDVLNTVYGTATCLIDDEEGGGENSMPLQQKIIICALLLYRRTAKNRHDVTVGKLHEVYRRVCGKRNIVGVDQSEFQGLLALIETRGIVRVCGKKEPRMHKVHLEWDEEEVLNALKDKQLISTILQDDISTGK